MYARRTLTCRRTRWARPWAIVMVIAMALMTNGGSSSFDPVAVSAQQQVAPVGNQGSSSTPMTCGSSTSRSWSRRTTPPAARCSGPGPNQVADPQLPMGLRTVDGSFNNLVPGQHLFGAADLPVPAPAAADLPFGGQAAVRSRRSGRTGRGAGDVLRQKTGVRHRLAAAPDQQPDRRSDRDQPGGGGRGRQPVRLRRLRLLGHHRARSRSPARCSSRTSRPTSVCRRRST